MSRDDDLDREMDSVKMQLDQERQMKQMLDQSLHELKLTSDEMNRRLNYVRDESNEWKTRHETQIEMNEMLQRQIVLLQDKVETSKKQLQELILEERQQRVDERNQAKGATAARAAIQRSSMGVTTGGFDVHPQTVRSLEKRKSQLAGEVRDFEQRLDAEARAHHTAEQEKRALSVEIQNLSAARLALEEKQRQTLEQHRNHQLTNGVVRKTSVSEDGSNSINKPKLKAPTQIPNSKTVKEKRPVVADSKPDQGPSGQRQGRKQQVFHSSYDELEKTKPTLADSYADHYYGAITDRSAAKPKKNVHRLPRIT